MEIAAGVAILLAFPAERTQSAIPTIKAPGPYPYETPAQVPAPTISESSVLPTSAPFPYLESSSPLSAVPGRNSRIANARRLLTAETVRKAAFKYNGVASFWGVLVAIPADVGVFDSKLSRTRTLVKGGRVMPKNVAWLRKHEGARGRLEKRNPRLKDDQIKAAMILARADFVNMRSRCHRGENANQ
jgi:hypothetical protein